MSFSAIGLMGPVMQGVSASGYSVPTEIQRKAIPLALNHKDLIGCAPTGTGKTAAFVLPILQRFESADSAGHRPNHPRALVLTPTRELAQQIEDCVNEYGKFTRIKPISLYGGVDIERQFRGLRQGVDIIIATPGRLLDHLERRSVSLSGIQVLVLDEADRMLDMGFIQDVRTIIAQVPATRQTMLFSATISREIYALASGIQKSPEVLEVGRPCSPVETVTQEFYAVSKPNKTDLLVHIIKNQPVETMLVFTRTKHGADKIARQLERQGISNAAIHSNRSQSQRQRALDGFKQRRFKVLVATDVAARGIDVERISHVVNYDTPVFPEDYVHRIGRTGRAEATGIALTFVSWEEEQYARKIQKLTGKKIDIKTYPGFERKDPIAATMTNPAPDPNQGRTRKYFRTPVFGRMRWA